MALFFNAMKALFKLVFTVSDKPRIFTSPGWVRSPLVVQDRIAELITAAAGLKALL